MSYKKEDFYSVVQSLSMFHNVFKTLWKLGAPVFSEKISTAAVKFDNKGQCIQFLFNPQFWEECDEYMRTFVISHECLHVILNHGVRSKGSDQSIANTALDIAVNHMLVNSFGFERDKIKNWEQYCWIETVFDKDIFGEVPDDKNFEYYYNLLIENAENYNKKFVLDEHSELPEDMQNVLKDYVSSLSENEKNSLKESLTNEDEDSQTSDDLQTGDTTDIFKEKEAKISQFWDQIIKDLEIHDIVEIKSQFVFSDRRLSLLNKNFLLPNKHKLKIRSLSKLKIHLYLDCSGSCKSLRKIFFRLAKTLNPDKYEVRLFSRTTEVQEIFKNESGEYVVPNIDGSDDFQCIEDHIQKELKEGKIKKYPVVIHFTDGGDCNRTKVKPAQPDKWYWMLQGKDKSKIPSECKNIHDISLIV